MFTLIVKGYILWKSGTQIHKITLNQKPKRERERKVFSEDLKLSTFEDSLKCQIIPQMWNR